MFPRRISEHFGDMSDLVVDGEEYEVDGTFISRRAGGDADQLLANIDEEEMEDTGEIRALTGRRDGRRSDVDLGVFGDMDDEADEPTFRFTIPQRIREPIRGEEEEQDDKDERLEDSRIDENTAAGVELDFDQDEDLDLGPAPPDD
jgi:hypothetical protein